MRKVGLLQTLNLTLSPILSVIALLAIMVTLTLNGQYSKSLYCLYIPHRPTNHPSLLKAYQSPSPPTGLPITLPSHRPTNHPSLTQAYQSPFPHTGLPITLPSHRPTNHPSLTQAYQSPFPHTGLPITLPSQRHTNHPSLTQAYQSPFPHTGLPITLPSQRPTNHLSLPQAYQSPLPMPSPLPPYSTAFSSPSVLFPTYSEVWQRPLSPSPEYKCVNITNFNFFYLSYFSYIHSKQSQAHT